MAKLVEGQLKQGLTPQTRIELSERPSTLIKLYKVALQHKAIYKNRHFIHQLTAS